jgi:hypothetical protein
MKLLSRKRYSSIRIRHERYFLDLTWQIDDLNSKFELMEHSLSHVVKEFERERDLIGTHARKELQQVQTIAQKLNKNLMKKTAEMKHIKRLSQHILNQRSDVEKFFMEALEDILVSVRKERAEQRKKDIQEYNQKIKRAMIGKAADMPFVQSFRPRVVNHIDLINAPPLPSIFDEKKEKVGEEVKNEEETPAMNVDIGDLKWTDKERVLRLLFAKMNGVTYSTQKQGEADQEESGDEEFSEYGTESTTSGFDARFADIGEQADNTGLGASSSHSIDSTSLVV